MLPNPKKRPRRTASRLCCRASVCFCAANLLQSVATPASEKPALVCGFGVHQGFSGSWRAAPSAAFWCMSVPMSVAP